jgi:hypothetical protein
MSNIYRHGTTRGDETAFIPDARPSQASSGAVPSHAPGPL